MKKIIVASLVLMQAATLSVPADINEVIAQRTDLHEIIETAPQPDYPDYSFNEQMYRQAGPEEIVSRPASTLRITVGNTSLRANLEDNATTHYGNRNPYY